MADPSKRHHPRCAVCKYLKGDCFPECPYAAHFPAGQPQRLRDVQRVFGIQRILHFSTDVVGTANQDDILNSIVYEAQAWVADPVRGPVGVVRARRQELESVRAEISALREQHKLQLQPPLPDFFFPEDLHVPMPTTTVQEENEESESSSTSKAMATGGPSSSKPSRRRPRCAACKCASASCGPGCSLAPFFPADQPLEHYMNVHRLFGRNNILHSINEDDPELRDEVMNSIIYNAQAWVRDPRHGAAGVVRALEQELKRARAELTALQQQDFPDPESVHQPTAALMPPPPTMFTSMVQENEESSTAQDVHENSLFGGALSMQNDANVYEADPPPQSSSSGPQYTPCAACAYLGWMCRPNCALAPYVQGESPESIRMFEYRVMNYINHLNSDSLGALQQSEANICDRDQRRRLQLQQPALMPTTTFSATVQGNEASSSSTMAQDGHHQATYFPANPWHQANSLMGHFQANSLFGNATVQHQPAAPSHQAETTALDGDPVAFHPPANELMPPPPTTTTIPGNEEPAAAATQVDETAENAAPSSTNRRFDDNSLLFVSDGGGGTDPSLNQDQMSSVPLMTLQDELTEQDLAQFLPDAPPNDEINRDG